MKTYLIKESNEPLNVGCLTQWGVIEKGGNYEFVHHPDGMVFSNYSELKHLKCYDITSMRETKEEIEQEFEKQFGNFSDLEITDPTKLQEIWNKIRGEKPIHVYSDSVKKEKSKQYIKAYGKWENFELKPNNLYEIDDNF